MAPTTAPNLIFDRMVMFVVGVAVILAVLFTFRAADAAEAGITATRSAVEANAAVLCDQAREIRALRTQVATLSGSPAPVFTPLSTCGLP